MFIARNTGSAWPWQLRKLERNLAAPGIAESIDDGTRTEVFKWPVVELKAWCPWYYFGGGIKLQRGPLVLRFSFGRPANTRIRSHQLGPGFALREAAANLSEIGTMRSRGRLWQAALGANASDKG
jgi:hypothetical protein